MVSELQSSEINSRKEQNYWRTASPHPLSTNNRWRLFWLEKISLGGPTLSPGLVYTLYRAPDVYKLDCVEGAEFSQLDHADCHEIK